MLITALGGVDLDVRAGTAAGEVTAAAGLARAWCGGVELDPDHPAGIPPLVHGARLTAQPAPPCMPPPGPHLRVVEGPDAGHVIAIDRAIVVGRGESADLRLQDAAVSAEHALVTGPARVRVRDLRSVNGTSAPRCRSLRPGEEFLVGRSRIAFVDSSAAQMGGDGPAAGAGNPDARRAPPVAGAPRRWGAIAGSLASGVALAAVTGRWPLAAVGVVPAAAAWLAQLVAGRGARTGVEAAADAGPIAVRGEQALTRGYVRACLVARGQRPIDPGWWEPWMRWLAPAQPDDRFVMLAPGSAWPSWCASRIDVKPDGRIEDDGSGPRTLPPLAYSAEAADLAARRLAAQRPDGDLPSAVRWGDLGPAHADDGGTYDPSPRGRRRARVAIGTCAGGTFVLDLDSDGPHILVAGMTGSGKSVALETLVSALALALPPSDLTLALIDFKGGAGLRECAGLPHVAATLTDLDGALARRAMAGLAHELTQRKAALRERGLSSLAEWESRGGAPPRLVVVIDEYQEIVASHPTFLPDLARIAAQGRSLGLHLVLATQRPAGAVTPEVRANVSTTIALRVSSAAESRDLLGGPEAAAIPAAIPGRAIVARGHHQVEVQLAAPGLEPSPGVARVGESPPPGTSVARAAALRWSAHEPAAPLWRAPLPDRWEPPAGPVSAVPLALVDAPDRREQWIVQWDPREGPVVMVGPARSGRTTALGSITAQARRVGLEPVWLPRDPRLASRTLTLASTRPEVLLLIDDVETVLTGLATVDDGAAAEDLARRVALRLPTAIAGDLATPMRLAASAAILSVHGGADAGVAAQWGVPRDLTAHSTLAPPGRFHLRHRGAWHAAQLAASAAVVASELVVSLPASVGTDGIDGALGVGGDRAEVVPVPTGDIAVVATAGSVRDAVLARLRGAQVHCVDVPALVPAGTQAVVIASPTARAVRALAPHGWRGLTDAVPLPGRVVLVRDGVGIAVQLPST